MSRTTKTTALQAIKHNREVTDPEIKRMVDVLTNGGKVGRIHNGTLYAIAGGTYGNKRRYIRNKKRNDRKKRLRDSEATACIE
jgi:hypothetical protein